MRIDVLTLFPEMFEGVFGASILGKARDKGIVELSAVNFRQYSLNKHGQVDDTPYGGGGGMVLKPEPIFAAVEDLLRRRESDAEEGTKSSEPGEKAQTEGTGRVRPSASGTEEEALAKLASVPSCAEAESDVPENAGLPAEELNKLAGISTSSRPRIVLLCPQGETFTQKKAEEFAKEEHLIFICGHYEGYDERIRTGLVTDEISIGDYVLTGGELPAMVMIDSTVRLLPGVLGNENSAVTDSFSTGLLEYPHYTRPTEFRGMKVPDILLSGHHANIESWRRRESLRRTLQRRPELLERLELTKQERKWLEELKREEHAAQDLSD
ncbi:tRNA (guanosine(37)-N1)-methyltransferase TrmD [Saccharibacillus alkalitolerans]|uniref:tRNA (guanine-N(1)-)-methyltransferase n=1 Tax=Saccharibacillus alkalitolerans TaxID=2705290 RepID=A0ABX0F3H7_9BACL|nr:tRNA (guanosine(37)-N1)-methyltransferase TrmD [Saccharibacillus alkalitolerans]NGZ75533.1 tRNA (guanosine(37)-N1)-methyltransferase TrmD [Saccharibacillus alkalitolerans]